MANTYSSIYIHVIFAVRHRARMIDENWEVSLQKYISGIIKSHKQKMMAINNMPDHMHILIGIRPEMHIASLIRDIKANSSRWINDQQFLSSRFEWQEGYGVFSVGERQVQIVIDYILNQKIHYQKKNFKDELIEELKAHSVEFDDRYIFKGVLE